MLESGQAKLVGFTYTNAFKFEDEFSEGKVEPVRGQLALLRGQNAVNLNIEEVRQNIE